MYVFLCEVCCDYNLVIFYITRNVDWIQFSVKKFQDFFRDCDNNSSDSNDIVCVNNCAIDRLFRLKEDLLVNSEFLVRIMNICARYID